MPNNHSVTIEDLENGTYAVHVAVAMPCSVKLVVNMDKDLPGQSGELPPVQLTFVDDADLDGARAIKDDEEPPDPAPEAEVTKETEDSFMRRTTSPKSARSNASRMTASPVPDAALDPKSARSNASRKSASPIPDAASDPAP